MKSLYYHARRFGLTPRKLCGRFSHPLSTPILANSIPKSGTHLLEALLIAHPDLSRILKRTVNPQVLGDAPNAFAGMLDRTRASGILVTHLHFTEAWAQEVARRQIPHLLMIRDPRDIVVSTAYYMCKNPKHYFHALFMAQPDHRTRLELVIRGDPEANYLGMVYELKTFTPWLQHHVHRVQFEELVGPSGGGSAEAQAEAVRSIFEYLGLGLSDEMLHSLAAKTFNSSSPTFRRGGIGQWRKEFDQDLIDLFQEKAGEYLSIMGYSEA